ncbi:613_t:CDS:2, partial [Scutellospora calospora]
MHNLPSDWSEDAEMGFSIGEDLTDTASSLLEETENLPDKEVDSSGKIVNKSGDLHTSDELSNEFLQERRVQEAQKSSIPELLEFNENNPYINSTRTAIEEESSFSEQEINTTPVTQQSENAQESTIKLTDRTPTENTMKIDSRIEDTRKETELKDPIATSGQPQDTTYLYKEDSTVMDMDDDNNTESNIGGSNNGTDHVMKEDGEGTWPWMPDDIKVSNQAGSIYSVKKAVEYLHSKSITPTASQMIVKELKVLESLQDGKEKRRLMKFLNYRLIGRQ